MSENKTIWLSHPDWAQPKEFPKEQALRMLKNQKLPDVPHKYRNLYKRAEDTNVKTAETDDKKSTTDSGSDKATDNKAKPGQRSKKS